MKNLKTKVFTKKTNPMKNLLIMYFKFIYLVSFLTCFSLLSQAQVEPPKDYTIKKSYTLTEETSYRFDDYDALTTSEKITKGRDRTVKEVNEYILPKGDKHTIINYLDNGNRYEDWMTEVKTVVIDEREMKSYDREGRLFKSFPHSDYYKLFNAITTIGLGKDFPTRLSERQAEALKKEGVKFNESPSNIISIENEVLQTNIFTKLKIIQKKYFDERTRELTRIEETHYELQMNGKYFPVKEIVKKQFTTIKGDCGMKVTVKTYSKYEIYDKTDGQRLGDDLLEALSDFTISPNPTTDRLTVRVPRLENEYKTELSIYSPEGKLVKRMESTASSIRVDVSGLNSGTYILEIRSSFFKESKKFIKN